MMSFHCSFAAHSQFLHELSCRDGRDHPTSDNDMGYDWSPSHLPVVVCCRGGVISLPPLGECLAVFTWSHQIYEGHGLTDTWKLLPNVQSPPVYRRLVCAPSFISACSRGVGANPDPFIIMENKSALCAFHVSFGVFWQHNKYIYSLVL